MLSSMRNGLFSKMFFALLLCAGFGLALSDWTGTFTAGTGSNNVAYISGSPIRAADFDRDVRRMLRGQNISVDDAYTMGLIDQILSAEIYQRIMLKAAREIGLEVDDKHIAERVHNMLEPMLAGSKDPAAKKEALNRFLTSQGFSEKELVNAIREELTTTLFRQTLAANNYVPETLANDLAIYDTEQRDIHVATLTATRMTQIKNPTEDQLKSFYEQVKSRYALPEERSFKIAILDSQKITGKLEITYQEIKDYFESNIDLYSTDESRSLEQLVVDTEEKAKSVLDKITKEKIGLKESAQAVLKDTKSYSAASDFNKDGLVEAIATPAFSAELGDVIGPIKTPLGWHIVKIAKINAGGVKELKAVESEIRKTLEATKSDDQVFEVTQQIEDRLAGGESIDVIAKEFGMAITQIDNIQQAKNDVKALSAFTKEDKEAIIDAAFSTEENESSVITGLSDGKYFSVQVDNIKPSSFRQLSAVKNEIEKTWLNAERMKANFVDAQQKLADLKAGKIALDKISTVQTHKNITRKTDEIKALSPEILRAAMGLDNDQYTLVPSGDNIAIVHVKNIKMGESGQIKKENIAAVKSKAETEMQNETLQVYLDYLQNRYNVKTNPALLKRLYEKKDEGNS